MKNLLVLIVLALLVILRCSSFTYDCQGAADNRAFQCDVTDAEVEGFENACKYGDSTRGPLTDAEIHCVVDAESCDALIACIL